MLPTLVRGEGPVGPATAIVVGMGYGRPATRAWAIDAMKILALRGELPADDLGWALGRLVRADTVKPMWPRARVAAAWSRRLANLPQTISPA